MEQQKKWMIHFRDSPFAQNFQLTDNTLSTARKLKFHAMEITNRVKLTFSGSMARKVIKPVSKTSTTQ